MRSLLKTLLIPSLALASPLAQPLPSPASLNRRAFLIPDALLTAPLYGAPDNDFSCRSATHPNPVIFLHGLSANREIDLNLLHRHLQTLGFCVFALTYGAHALAPWIGGVEAMAGSAREIAAFVDEVRRRTGADRVDLVGHSEGGVMALYVPRTQPGLAAVVEHTVALGPAVHGAEYFGFTALWYVGGQATRDVVAAALHVIGCAACDDLAVGGATTELFADGNAIVQQGNEATIIVSRYDTLVPPEKSVIDEEGVRNVYVQDACPEDRVGHAGLAWDLGVWGLVVNALTENYDAPVTCDAGLPF